MPPLLASAFPAAKERGGAIDKPTLRRGPAAKVGAHRRQEQVDDGEAKKQAKRRRAQGHLESELGFV
jgi:hypothetical protein